MYRQVDSKLWTDQKFLSLGNDGRMLWLFLLTTRFAVNIIPGVIIAGDGAIAEDLDWKSTRLRAAFVDLSDREMSIRREGRLIWLPNAFRHQKIPGPRSITGISKIWGDVPDGDLKLEIFAALTIACATWDVVFAKEFAKHLHLIPAKGIGKGIPNPIPQVEATGSTQYKSSTGTEQEQEQYVSARARGGHTPERHPDAGSIAGAVWQHAAKTQGDLRLANVNAPSWPLMAKGSNRGWGELLARVCELLVDSTVEQAQAVAINRVDVAAAKARQSGDGSYFTPIAMFSPKSFETWSVLTPDQVLRKSPQGGSRSQTALDAQLERVRMLEAEEAARGEAP